MKTKGLGKKQKEILTELKNGYVIRGLRDYSRDEYTCTLQDEDGANFIIDLRPDFVHKLYERGLLTMEEFNPFVGIDIFTFRIKK